MRSILVAIYTLLFLLSFDLSYTYVSFHQRKEAILDCFVSINSASGFVSNIEGDKVYVLTAAHVIDDDPEVKILVPFFNHKDEMIDFIESKGVVVEKNDELDYAIVEIEDSFLSRHRRKVEVESHFRLEDKVISVGQPEFKVWVNEGTIGNITEQIGHSAGLFYGSSGGPLFNDSYRVIGINVSVSIKRVILDKDRSFKYPISFMSYATPIRKVMKDLGPEKVKKYFGG